MLHTPDWEQAKQRYDLFWQRKPADRALLSLNVENSGTDCPVPPPPPPADLKDQWENQNRLLQSWLYGIYHTTYLGEGFPSFFVNMGPGALAACIGGSYQLAPHTVWFENEPFLIRDFEEFDPASLRLLPDSLAYQAVERITRTLAAQSQGRFLTSMTDIGGTLDVVASLRGTQTLLMDLYDYPDEVLAAANRVDELWEECYTRLAQLIAPYQEGTGSWQGLYCRGTHYPLQCDFSAMVSPEQFQRFVIPSLQRHCRFLDHSIYHWDGPGQLCHLDSLLSIPELDAIQWVPGDGAPDQADDQWLPYYRRIQDSGKNLILHQITPPMAKKLLSRLDHRGLWLCVDRCSQEDARELLRFASRQAR